MAYERLQEFGFHIISPIEGGISNLNADSVQFHTQEIDAEESALENLEKLEKYQLILTSLNRLVENNVISKRNADIFKRRVGLVSGQPQDCEEISRVYGGGMKRQRVSAIEKTVAKHLKKVVLSRRQWQEQMDSGI